jgi:hypothetical protein
MENTVHLLNLQQGLNSPSKGLNHIQFGSPLFSGKEEDREGKKNWIS